MKRTLIGYLLVRGVQVLRGCEIWGRGELEDSSGLRERILFQL